ncbi:MAG: hypothetical protein EXR83_01020 [Gammaproteobacteria bacterium]|nr:hypothetical protein [Gammaproteobacteria bacterium]
MTPHKIVFRTLDAIGGIAGAGSGLALVEASVGFVGLPEAVALQIFTTSFVLALVALAIARLVQLVGILLAAPKFDQRRATAPQPLSSADPQPQSELQRAA